MTSVYQCNVIVCAMFLTGQASNPIIARFAKEVTGIELTYARWAIGAIVPGLLSLLLVPWVLYRVFPPEVKHTPAASELASKN
jgi:DASS family divalent anion:Na+ symporter